jgi:hypothetical protein
MENRKLKQVLLGELVPVGRGGCKERVWEGEYGRNVMYSCKQMEKRDLLKLFQEWGEGG